MKISKTPSKRTSPPHPDVLDLINKLLETPPDDLAAYIALIPEWKWPRSDLYAWIKVLNKFDVILKDAIQDYDVDKLQVNAFTPLTKSTILEILRFQRMLLENSTSRKLYSSYDRLNSLLFSSDLDVVLASLKVILRPAQQYSSQPPSAHTSNISSARLQALAQSWSILREHTIELHDLLDSTKSLSDIDLSGEAGDITFQFYRKTSEQRKEPPSEDPVASSSKPASQPPVSDGSPSKTVKPVAASQTATSGKTHKPGSTILHLTGIANSPKDPMHILADVVEEHDLPDEEKFSLLCKIRILKSLTRDGREEREKLNAARLLAIAIFAHTHSESQASSSLFLYDPDLVNHISELVHPDRAISMEVQIAALTALDGLGRYRSRIGEVLSAVNAGVSHGTLLSLLRRTVGQLGDQTANFTNDFAETLLSLLSLLTSTPGGGTAIVGAGLIPLLIQVIEAKLPTRIPVVSKTLALLDNVLYVFANAFQVFCNNRGVDVLVERIAHEVNYNIEKYQDEKELSPAISSYGRLEFVRSSLLKHLLRSMHRMMQASGSAEGLRTLIDSSLPQSIQKIMANRVIFGPPIFSISINLMSIFVHNEPTSLLILQEQHIPETLFDAIEAGIEPALEVISALPNAIGALCLNPAGEAQMAARNNIIPSIFATFTSEKHLKVMGDKDNAIMIGSAIDELVRHHPSLKPQVFDAIQKMLQSVEDLGKAWLPPKGEEKYYGLVQTSAPTDQPPTESGDVSMDITSEILSLEPTPVAAPATSVTVSPPRQPETLNEDDKDAKQEESPSENVALSFMDVAVKVLEGFFQHAPHCRDFILKQDGVERLGRLLALPSLPIRFNDCVPAESITQVFRTMAELVPKETLSRLSSLVRSALNDTEDFWKTMSKDSRLSPFLDTSPDSDLSAANTQFRKLLTLQNLVGLLADVYQTAGYSHSRSATIILQVLNGEDAPEVIEDLGRLHRAFVWESIVLESSQSTSTTPNKVDRDNTGALSSTQRVEPSDMSSVTGSAAQPGGEGAPPSTSLAPPLITNTNEKAVKYIVSLIPTSLTPFFQAIVKMFMFNRRNPETPLKSQASELAQRVSRVLLEHCAWHGDVSKLSLAYSSLVVSLIAVLFCDERTAQNSLHTLLVVVFQQRGGIEAVLDMGRRCVASINRLVGVSREELTLDTEKELAYAFSALNVIIHLLNMLVSSKPLLESPQTLPLITRDKPPSDPSYFEPHDFLVRMRFAALPFLLQVWKSAWLSSAPLVALKSIIRTMVEIAAAENESGTTDAPETPAIVTAIPPQIRAAPDQATIDQLVDMGFGRGAAERALVRTRNNVNAAAELLLNHSYLFVNIPEPPLPIANEDPDGPAALNVQDPIPIPADGAEAQNEPSENPESVVVPENVADPPTTSEAANVDDIPPEDLAQTPVRDWKLELDNARTDLRAEVTHRALSLVDHHPGLVFEARAAFIRLGRQHPDQTMLLTLVDVHIPERGSEDDKENVLASRCRLLALIFNDPAFASSGLPDGQAEALMDGLVSLLKVAEQTIAAKKEPRWLAPHFLAVEALLILGEGITSVKVPTPEEEISDVELYGGPRHEASRSLVFDSCLKLLLVETLSRDAMLSTLRLLVLLTRDHQFSAELVSRQGVSVLLDLFKSPSKDMLVYRPHIFIILRHVIEDLTTVQGIIQQNLKRYFHVARTRAVEVGTLVRNTGPLALRDPKAFVAACKSSCRLTPSRSSSSYAISLKSDDSPQHTPEAAKPSTEDPMLVENSPTLEGMTCQLSDTLIHYLMAELLRVGRQAATTPRSTTHPNPPTDTLTQPADAQGPSGSSTIPTSSSSENSDYQYACVLMQSLAELLSSYNICKLSFVNYHKKRSLSTHKEQSSKHRPSILNFLLVDILSADSALTGDGVQKKASLSTWATSVVVALCTDPNFSTPSKDPSDDLGVVRKFVLDALAKTIKDIPVIDPPEIRYGKLFALADLCYRLLTSRAPQTPGVKEDSTIQIAKTMLEKNFVAILTSSLVDADLHYPGMKSLVGMIMRPLEHLTKIAIKMGRAAGRPKDGQPDTMETESVHSSDQEGAEAPDHEDMPDLYRNSSLGIFGGDMEDVEYNPQDESGMDEDDENDDDGEMEYGDDDSSGTEDSSEDEVLDEGEPRTLNMGIDESGENDWEDEMDQDEEGSDDEDDHDDESHQDVVDAEAEMLWQPNTNDEIPPGAVVIQDADDEDGLGEEIPVLHEESGEEEGNSTEEDDFIDPGVLELATDAGGNDDEALWGAEAAPWNAVPGQDIPPMRQQLATAVARRGRPPVGIAGPPGNALDTGSHPLLVEGPPSHPQETSIPVIRGTHRRHGHGGVIASGVNYNDLVQTIQHLVGGEGAQLLAQLINHGRDAGAETLHLEMAPDGGTLLGTLGRGHLHHLHADPPHIYRTDRRARSHPIDAAQFPHQSTVHRWAEEAKLTQGRLTSDRLGKLINHVIISLLPASRETARLAKEEQERLLAEERERNEREAKSSEEEHQSQQEDQVAQRDSQATPTPIVVPSTDEDVLMTDVHPVDADAEIPSDAMETSPSETIAVPPPAETIAPDEITDPDQPSSSLTEPVPPVTVLVHGNPVDITDTGIDPTFLEALPDDMREEIINQHFRERRFAAQAERPVDSQISPEFLDALPADIRAEILQQESMEQARRQRSQAAQARGETTSGPSDIDPASFLATLDPQLRQAVLLEQEDGFLQTLPSAMIAEANIMREQVSRRLARSAAVGEPVPPTNVATRKAPSARDAVQLLDRTGIATLVRLLFFPHAHKRSSLHKVLVNLCENSKTRTELLNIFLTILQNGTADMSAVDKSFSQMSVRTSRVVAPKASPRPKSTLDVNLPFLNPSSDTIPNLATQRCLEALTAIVHSNDHASIFFLTEHELPLGIKKGVSKKGKGKEKLVTQTHFPIVLLLGLLDKPSILKTPSMMDAVVALLSSVTRPLASLKDSLPHNEPKTPGDVPVAVQATSTNVGTLDAAPSADSVITPGTHETANQPTNIEPPKSEDLTARILPSPPQIPHSVLRFVVNILTTGECSARTFQHTLALIQNLSHLTDARDTIAAELRTKAQESGQTLYSDLDDLASTLKTSESGDAVPSASISKFSSPASDQAKLLRVLKTIDYMYSGKNPASGIAPIPRSNAASTSAKADQDKAHAIYDSFRFGSLWRRLGDCLKIVSEKPDMEHIATVLLPLIESLMVVCKYLGTDAGHLRALRASASPRSPSTSRENAQDLFVTFTDEHRKILNIMVRNNPSLMSGSFSLLVQNARVLDFDNKRNYFNQKLRRRPSNRDHYNTLQVNVRRQRVFEDSFQHLQRFTGDQIKYGKLSVRFYDEEGVDAGGVTREWFQILARQMFNPDYALFQPCAADRLTYQPNQASYINSEHLAFFKFVGRIIGKAIYDGRLLDAYFARSLYRQMLGKPVDYRDVEWVDPEYYKSLCWILENDPSVLDLTFSVEANAFGLTKVVPLKENGTSIPVTNENKREYVQLSAEYRLVSSIKDQIEAFLNGFYDIIPKDLISIFNEQELELLISGTPDIDVDEWRAATDYTGYTPADPVIVWWWRALKSFNRDERAKVLSFATGTSKVPLGGFVDLQGVQGIQRFSIHKAYGDSDRLPQAHTCFNQIDLPQYASYDKLRTQLLMAINEGGEGFGFA